jgi:PAS domain S-box-containing protein
MDRRHYDRLANPGRRDRDRRIPVAECRRVLLVGADEAWRLLTTYVFEEAGYTVYAAANQAQAVAFTTRLLPDVVVIAVETPETVEILIRISADSSTQDIPVVVLTRSLHSSNAGRVREAGGITLRPHAAEVDVLVGEVDTLIAAGPRVRRTLKRRLLDIQELARFYSPDEAGQACLRAVIDHLQVAIFAVDAQGHCLAASQGATRLTGYSRRQLVSTAVCDATCVDEPVFDPRWRHVLRHKHETPATSIINSAGEDVAVHAAIVADVLPGVHVVAMAAT